MQWFLTCGVIKRDNPNDAEPREQKIRGTLKNSESRESHFPGGREVARGGCPAPNSKGKFRQGPFLATTVDTQSDQFIETRCRRKKGGRGALALNFSNHGGITKGTPDEPRGSCTQNNVKLPSKEKRRRQPRKRIRPGQWGEKWKEKKN